MRAIKYLVLSVLIATLWTGCKNKTDRSDAGAVGTPLSITTSINEIVSTTRGGGYTFSFQAGDAIGIWVYEGASLKYSNKKWVYDGSTWRPENSDEGVYYKGTPLTIKAYYPYDPEASVLPTAETFTVKADQSTEAAYKASDLLVSTNTWMGATQPLSLHFDHAMAMIQLDLSQSEKLAQSTGATLKAQRKQGSAEESLTFFQMGEATYRALLPPQTLRVEVQFSFSGSQPLGFALRGESVVGGKFYTYQPYEETLVQIKNLLSNGDFEQDPIGWDRTYFDGDPNKFNIDYVTNEGWSGSKCLKIESSDPAIPGWVLDNLNLEEGKTYQLSGKIKTEGISHAGVVVVQDGDLRAVYTHQENHDWEEFSTGFFSVTAGSTSIILSLGTVFGDNSPGTIWFDDLKITEYFEGIDASSLDKYYTTVESEKSKVVISNVYNQFSDQELQHFLKHVDKVYTALVRLHSGKMPYNGRKVVIYADDDLSKNDPEAWGYAGDPIHINSPATVSLILNYLKTGYGDFGLMHEMGHNFGPGHLGATNGAWDFTDEMYTNIRLCYVIETENIYINFNGLIASGGPGTGKNIYQYYYNTQIGSGLPGNHDAANYTVLRITDKYGWDPVIYAFDKMNSLPANYPVGATNYDKFFFFVKTMYEVIDGGGKDYLETYTQNELNLLKQGLNQ